MPLWARLAQALDRHGAAAMATLVETEGSSPREAGARIVALPDGTFFGTIGGGTLEWQVLAQLQALLARGAAARFERRTVALGPELGQCCGGRVGIAYERFAAADRPEVGLLAEAEARGAFVTSGLVEGARLHRRMIEATIRPGDLERRGEAILEGFGEDRRTLYLFGAGHVGRALVLALAPLPFRVVWVDPRPGAFPAAMPQNVTPVQPENPAGLLAHAPAGSFVLVMTHSHPLDLEIIDAALRLETIAETGLIGSATKRARFTSQLRQAGVATERIERLICPIGIPGIRSKDPAVIAAATAADMIRRDEALSARRSAGAERRFGKAG
ncbi:xanthine dehydrogenase accessory protein XdhC [Prosthecomicrobium pneumaticum]|uniref:Xanthine dehydrogenase accessory factor n=1 Tax=Prosthecomicrobium pneumaticum TaxID=81895 RepID=A0A7W9FKQ1_9HYPH|nr:xanthine dehydrogenase accessory protein XdhC [Prosthecomicrobium pneumaticum]MBB5751273.1 xanthine dehydrogenase accessory factor [Prosthecomicrobium pneumaticum]